MNTFASKDQIIFRVNSSITPTELSNVFKESGVKRPSEDLLRLKRMIENADILISAWDGEKLIGIARAITDFSYCCYLSDLAVNKEYQKQGIGKELVTLVKENISDEVTLLLLSSPTAMNYYPRIGFERIDNGFRILRKI
ncbi:GNAT family N-acetyltransferase [Litchfieldia alkalitelluris]|uniref:GNAT family N-acetyltransferase n=1 Tax=Litchfieldia alkalitelluris TaxID=304268 RepID=UPI00099798D6|nr:GNAT family N-acetyltransferase [Litchfieldia alkalitelluris]